MESLASQHWQISFNEFGFNRTSLSNKLIDALLRLCAVSWAKRTLFYVSLLISIYESQSSFLLFTAEYITYVQVIDFQFFLQFYIDINYLHCCFR